MSELSNPQGIRQAVVTQPGPEREWLTYAQATEIVGLSRVTLWKLVSAGEVEAARVGRAVRLKCSYSPAAASRSPQVHLRASGKSLSGTCPLPTSSLYSSGYSDTPL
jgi:excisionase family DNA binding protein